MNSSDTDDDDTENNSMFGESQESFDDDNDTTDSLNSETGPYQKLSNTPAQEVVHAFGCAVHSAKHINERNDLSTKSYRKRMWYVPYIVKRFPSIVFENNYEP